MAEIVKFAISAYAGEDLTGKEGYVVKIDGVRQGLPVVKTAADHTKAIGVILRGEKQNEAVRIAVEGIVDVVAGGNIVGGAEVEVSQGKVVTKTSGQAIGIALADATNGSIIPVLLKLSTFSTTSSNNSGNNTSSI